MLRKGNLTHVKSRMLAQESQETRSSVCGGLGAFGKYMGGWVGGWGTCSGCVGASSEGNKFHAARIGGQRRKERRKERNPVSKQE